MNGRDYGLALLALSLLVFVWELAAFLGTYNPELFPPPSKFYHGFVTMVEEGIWWRDMEVSMRRYGMGFVLGNCLGIFFGVLTGRNRTFASMTTPLFNYLRAIPAVALIPLSIVWFGIEDPGKVFIITWGCTFPVWLSTSVGTQEVEQEYVRAAQTFGAKGWRLYKEVFFPRALPYVLAGSRISIATGFFALAAAEMSGASEGIGYRIFHSYEFFQIDRMVSAIVTIGLLALLMDSVFMVCVRRLFPWGETAQNLGTST